MNNDEGILKKGLSVSKDKILKLNLKSIHKKSLMQAIAETHHFCGECKHYFTPECPEGIDEETNHPIARTTDRACPLFEPRWKKGERRLRRDRRAKKRKGEWKLDINSYVPPTLKPCGFYGNQLNEAVWLPYTHTDGETKLRPTVVTIKKGKEPEYIDYRDTKIAFKGVFPSQNMESLMSVNAVKMLKSKTPIDPHTIDEEIDKAFKKHLDMHDAERILCKRWIQGSFFYDTFDAYPIQSIIGASESGKSRLCLLNLALCYHSEVIVDPTEAVIFRSKEEDRVTLIIDEAEYLRDPRLFKTIKILLNASYSKHSGYVSRYDEVNGKRVKMRFDLYSPMSISGIAGIEGVTASRSFKIVMLRVDKDFPKATPTMYRQLRDKLYVTRIRECFNIQKLYQETDISDFVSARFEELFKPLFCMTTFFGTEEEYKIMRKWCKEYQRNFRLEALNVSDEEQILICIYELQEEAKKDYTQDPFYTSLKQLADRVSLKYTRNMKSRTVSNILRRLGFGTRKQIHGYMYAHTPPQQVEDSARRLGLTTPKRSPNSPKSPKPQEEKEQKQLF